MYKNLAKHGRFGDTEMVKTSSGSLWHVSKREKKLIEEYGKVGEQLLNNIAPSTINPKTGKEEKWLAAAAMFGLGLAQQYGSTRADREQGREQVGILSEGISSLKEAGSSLQEVLGSNLQIATEKAKRTYTQGAEQFSETLGKFKKSKENIAGKMGFASSEMGQDDSVKLYRKEAKRKLEDIDIGLSENLSAVLSTYEKQKFDNEIQIQQMENQRKLAERQSQQKYFGIV